MVVSARQPLRPAALARRGAATVRGAGSREGVPAWARAVPLLAGFAVIEQARARAPGRADHHRPAPGPLSTAYFPAREPAGSINCTKVRPSSTSSASTSATAATAAVSKARRPEPASLAICDPAGRVGPAVQKHHLLSPRSASLSTCAIDPTSRGWHVHPPDRDGNRPKRKSVGGAALGLCRSLWQPGCLPRCGGASPFPVSVAR